MKDLTELVFILDKSGSMNGLESDTIGGFNSTIDKQKKVDGKCLVSTILFSNDSVVLHDRVDIQEIKKMTEDDYKADGCTALIDAMGGAIKHIKKVHKYIRKEDVPEKVLFVITTDGMENASSKYTSDDVKKMVEEQKEKGWEFLFLGANIDAVETAKQYGIYEDRVANYINDSEGIEVCNMSFSRAIESFRDKEICKDWNVDVKRDYSKRKK